MSMESLETFRESYHRIQELQVENKSADKITLAFNAFDQKTSAILRDKIVAVLSKIRKEYAKSRAEANFQKDDYLEFIDQLGRRVTMGFLTIDYSKMKNEDACKLRNKIQEVLNVRNKMVWTTIQGWHV